MYIRILKLLEQWQTNRIEVLKTEFVRAELFTRDILSFVH